MIALVVGERAACNADVHDARAVVLDPEPVVAGDDAGVRERAVRHVERGQCARRIHDHHVVLGRSGHRAVRHAACAGELRELDAGLPDGVAIPAHGHRLKGQVVHIAAADSVITAVLHVHVGQLHVAGGGQQDTRPRRTLDGAARTG